MVLGQVDVVDVQRVGGAVIHYTEASVHVGSSVDISVNWERRFDHMQMHTGAIRLSDFCRPS